MAMATLGALSFNSRPSEVLLRTGSSRRVRTRRCRVVAKFGLPDLPYELDALEPHMSRKTLEFHWGKHQRAYIDNLNKQIENTELEGCLLDDIVLKTYNRGNPQPAFNNASQAWNHDFFFNSMCRDGGKAPTGEIAELIDKHFGSYDEFVKQFKQAATTQFGSGWAWLSLKEAKLVIDKTPNAVSPLIWDQIPLLVIDVWEHAYYLDYQNRRPDYVTTFLDHLVNWETVNARVDRAKAFINLGEPTIPGFLEHK